MAEIGSVLDGKYEIVRQIGKGGMSRVYLARDCRLDKQWAVKEICKSGNGKRDAIVKQSLLAEANLMKRLDHPALPRIVDIIDEGVTIYIVMDYIEGRSMDRVLAEEGAQPEEKVLAWARQICDAFAYLHSRQPPIIYRDMKPSNLILRPEGQVKIIDFGIAREYKDQSLSDTTVLGTRGYASPEHYGSRQTDARSDIYTLGMTLHHLLTGANPRDKGYQYQSVRQLRPELSPEIEAIVDKCTALDPDARYQTCAQLMRDLSNPKRRLLLPLGEERLRQRLLRVSVTLSIFFLFLGVLCCALQSHHRQQEYEALISVISSTSYEEKVAAYVEAITLFPGRTEAYLLLLEAYEEEGIFGKEQNDEFLSLYNANQTRLDADSSRVAELNYKIGTMYFNYYSDGDEGTSFSARVQKAYPFFAAIAENENLSSTFSDWDLAVCYYQICGFYKTYVLSASNIYEVPEEEFEDLLVTIEACVFLLSEAEAYDQLVLYHGVVMLLYDQRESMAAVGISRTKILELLDLVEEKARGLTVQKEQSKVLQEEILDYYETYRKAIERIYDRTTEGDGENG